MCEGLQACSAFINYAYPVPNTHTHTLTHTPDLARSFITPLLTLLTLQQSLLWGLVILLAPRGGKGALKGQGLWLAKDRTKAKSTPSPSPLQD